MAPWPHLPNPTQVPGPKTKCKAMAHTNTHAAQLTKDNGRITNNMDLVFINSLMGLFIKDNGRNIKCMERDGLLRLMEGSGRGSIGRGGFRRGGRRSWCIRNKLRKRKCNPRQMWSLLLPLWFKCLPKVIRKPLNKTSRLILLPVKLLNSKLSNPILNLTKDHNKNGLIC